MGVILVIVFVAFWVIFIKVVNKHAEKEGIKQHD